MRVLIVCSLFVMRYHYIVWMRVQKRSGTLHNKWSGTGIDLDFDESSTFVYKVRNLVKAYDKPIKCSIFICICPYEFLNLPSSDFYNQRGLHPDKYVRH